MNKVQKGSGFKTIYHWLFYLFPWVLLVELFHYHFQSFLGYPRFLHGPQPFDLVTGVDIYVVFVVVFFAIGYFTKKIKVSLKDLPPIFLVASGLLLFAGVLQIFVPRELIEPILSTPQKYFLSFFLLPLILTFLLFTTFDKKAIDKLVQSYLGMVSFFCLLALMQHFTGWFPGEQKDFMGRLVWPFIDFVTLKSASANWVAFFVTPGVVLSFAQVFETLRSKKWKRLIGKEEFWLPLMVLLLAVPTLYLTQSYGGYIAVFVAVFFYLFRALPFHKFLMGAVVMAIVAGGVFVHQQSTWKYQVLTGEADYRFDTSATSRVDIYKMGLHMVREHPLLGVGMNQFQSYFSANQVDVLGEALNESHIPPHAHNFFLSMWTNLGLFGFLGMLILVFGIFWCTKFDPLHPAVFAIVAIMVHGLIDSWYWKQEIVYVFWLMVVFAHVYHLKVRRKK